MESRAEGRIKSEEIRANKIMTKKTVIEGVDCRGGGKKERRERQMTEQRRGDKSGEEKENVQK